MASSNTMANEAAKQLLTTNSKTLDTSLSKKDSMKVRLISNDNKRFDVIFKVVQRARTIRDLINDLGVEPDDENATEAIPLPNLSADILEKILLWLEHHRDDESFENLDDEEKSFDIMPWDRQFIGSDVDDIIDVLLAANYLNIKHLINLCTQTIADMMKGKSVEELRTTFRIENDYSPEEEEALRRENSWALQE